MTWTTSAPFIEAFTADTFRDEELGRLPVMTRLIYLGLGILADERGVLEERPRRIAADLFPFDADIDAATIAAGIDDLERIGRLSRRRYNGRALIELSTTSRAMTSDEE